MRRQNHSVTVRRTAHLRLATYVFEFRPVSLAHRIESIRTGYFLKSSPFGWKVPVISSRTWKEDACVSTYKTRRRSASANDARTDLVNTCFDLRSRGGFVFALIGIITLDDFRVCLRQHLPWFLNSTVSDTTATVQGVRVFVGDLLRKPYSHHANVAYCPTPSSAPSAPWARAIRASFNAWDGELIVSHGLSVIGSLVVEGLHLKGILEAQRLIAGHPFAFARSPGICIF